MIYQEAAIESAQRYYQFLTDNGRGKITYHVSHVEEKGECFLLSLDGKLAMPDFVQVQIYNTVYSQAQIHLYEYDNQRRTVKVRLLSEFKDVLARAPINEVKVISDLRFLVSRVEEWYKRYGGQLRLPTSFPQIQNPVIPTLRDVPSEDQKEAIWGAVSSPFTYIWGAPGTGKTRFVLARCVLIYIQAKKRILIVAPTNNAVEQMLYGVLSVLEEAGIPLDGILRLGTASAKFAEHYPSLCEDAALAKQLSEISNQITATKNLIAENEELIGLLPGMAYYNEFEKNYAECTEKLPSLFEHLRTLLNQEVSATNEIAVLKGKELLHKEQIKRIKASRAKASSEIEALLVKLEKYGRKLSRMLMPRRYDQCVTDIQNAVNVVDKLANEIEMEEMLLQKDSEQLVQHTLLLEKLRETISDCQWQLVAATAFFKKSNPIASEKVTLNNIETFYARLHETLDKAQTRLKTLEVRYAKVKGLSEQVLSEKNRELREELARHEFEKEGAEARGTGERVRQCHILAATIDTCMSRILPDGDYQPDHVFMDEAGYCSLIKGATLTAYGCPLTFLGDHMQLPPVCEMNDDCFMDERNAAVSLWAQSALYTEEALTEHPQDVFAGYLSHAPAAFNQMRKYDLVHTYRFGELLARILATEVYADDFHGEKDCETSILYINATKPLGSQKRTSDSECAAIAEYLRENGNCDIGIITPYKSQREKLKKLFNHNKDLSDSVMTVHGSQGREWDVVLFSVTDTTDKWFTDSLSLKSNGKKVINTAVSRAKKKLILVCDADYWMTQKKQLIGKLLFVADRLN